MKKMLLILTLILILPRWSSAQGLGSGNKLWLSAYFELQESKIKVEEESKQTDLKIAQNEQQIRQINELLAKIQRAMIVGTEKQKQDAQQAKPHAEEALMKAKQTQKVLKEQKMQCQWRMTVVQENERQLKEMYSKIASNNNVAGLVKECSGRVKIINLKTNKLEDACSSYIPISEGDEIATSSDGRIELKILDGRGNFIIGPDSKVLMKRKSADEDTFELTQGKVHTKVEKADEITKKMSEFVQKYKEDLKTIKGWAEEKIGEYKKGFKKELIKCSYQVRTPAACVCVRGTEFAMETNKADFTKISVIEGSVEVTHTVKNEPYDIPEGYEAIISGETLTKRKIENLERWWER